MDLFEMLTEAVAHSASDLFISVDSAPLIKVEGKILALQKERFNSQQNAELIFSVLNEEHIAEFKLKKELNISLNLDGVGRFRVNVFQQSGEPAMVVRHIKNIIPSIEELKLPQELKELIQKERGLILIVGATGAGKSTTLASMIDYRNSTQTGHILTIEDPIEFVHENKLSLVNQREVGVDTESFENALKNGLRESPDVILIGEIRDKETMKHALSYAETGHLCLATLHANNANQALDRIVNFFPEDARKSIFQDLALYLNAIVAQRLCTGIETKRIAAVELMIKTSFIQKLIDKGRIDDIKEAMRRSEGRLNQTFDDSLYKLIKAGQITLKEGLRKADSANNLRVRFKLEDGTDSQKHVNSNELVINHKVPFDHFKTFSITPLTVRAKNADTKTKINTALYNAMVDKGLKLESKNTDIDVQYILGLKVEEGLALEMIDGQQNNFEHFIPETKEQAMLVINVIDNRNKKAIFRITAVRNVSDFNETQESINKGIAKLLIKLPVDASKTLL